MFHIEHVENSPQQNVSENDKKLPLNTKEMEYLTEEKKQQKVLGHFILKVNINNLKIY